MVTSWQKEVAMLDQYFHSPKVRGRLHASPIHDEIERLVVHLDERGYSRNVVQQYVQAVEHFAAWAFARHTEEISIDRTGIDRFLKEHVPKCRCPPPASRTVVVLRAALNHLLAVSKPPSVQDASGLKSERLIDEYMAHLEKNCGLADETLQYRARYAREFLSGIGYDLSATLDGISPQDVMRFVTDCAVRCRRSSAQVAACSLRSFLRFLNMRGLCHSGLVRAVPRIPRWKKEGLPNTLSDHELGVLLGAFDRSSVTGRRDYAMTLCMTELALRVSDVVAIDLDDIDWRNGVMSIRSSKARRCRTLPITDQLGKAIARYLKAGRPTVGSRRLFVRHRAPVCDPVSPALVRGVIRRACERAGLPADKTGTHILRHTTASRLFQRGASLKDVADLLGHRSLETTTIYTKVNLPLLASVALPWPEVQP
jgi:integrase/recombinase XerD